LKVKGYAKRYCLAEKKYTKRMAKFKLKEDYLRLNCLFEQLNFKKLKRGLIHSDLNPSNLLRSKQGKIVFIDWADMHSDLYAYELAIVVAQLLTKNNIIYKNQIRLLIKGYETLRKLNTEEKKAIYVAAYWRLLDAIDWAVEQIEHHPDMKRKITKWLIDLRKRYKLFGKWPIEEFLENLE
jgi:Ser/Thr protein kinase RdoA (MazF antagonist)